MGKIDLSINKAGLENNIRKAKENNIIIPTIAQMQNPDLIPAEIKAKLSKTGLWDVDPVNLFRISWHNEAKESGGLFQEVPNYVEIPSALSGVKCRIIAMAGNNCFHRFADRFVVHKTLLICIIIGDCQIINKVFFTTYFIITMRILILLIA